MISKRHFLGLTAASLALGLSAGASAQEKVLRVGFQKYGKIVLLKGKGSLEKAVEPLGYRVAWTEFPAGPQLLEAINVGAIDIGNTGEAPPIFAQAAGAPLLYVAYEPPAPKGEAILIPKNSPLKTVAELKGKKVALNKGSNVHYLLVKALENAGFQVSSYDNGLSAYQRLREEPFEMLLTDIVMPEMDGIELARRASELDPDIKIMFITGFAAVALNSDSEAPKNAKVLAKPVHLRELVSEVNKMLAA